MAEEVGFWVIVAIAGGAFGVRRWRRRRWRIRIVNFAGNVTRVMICKPGAAPVGVARIPMFSEDYDQRLADAEAKAYDKCAALNAEEKRNRR